MYIVIILSDSKHYNLKYPGCYLVTGTLLTPVDMLLVFTSVVENGSLALTHTK